MDKKFLGLRVGTWLSLLGCLIVAVFVWLFVTYRDGIPTEAAMCLPFIGGHV